MKVCTGLRKVRGKGGRKEEGMKGDANVRKGNRPSEEECGRRCRKISIERADIMKLEERAEIIEKKKES